MAGDLNPDDDVLLDDGDLLEDFDERVDAAVLAPGERGAGGHLPPQPEPGAAGEGGPLVFTVDERGAGQRLDSVLAELAGVSRAQAKRWIEQDRVRVAGGAARASRVVALGETIEAQPGAPAAMSLEPEPIALVVLFEDRDLIVLDKPAGLVVHPAPGHPSGTLVNALLHHCRGELAGIGGVLRPGIVHRLDRGTSGVLVAAKTDLAHQGLAAQFACHSIDRVYRTFVRGLPKADSGRIDRPIGRHPEDRPRMSVRTRSGRPATTHWRVVARDRANAVAELEIRPETGRTHQIRVHLASAGLPVVGDIVYGRARGEEARLGRPALHAAHLGFVHPRTGARLGFDAPLPPDLIALVASLRLEPVGGEPGRAGDRSDGGGSGSIERGAGRGGRGADR